MRSGESIVPAVLAVAIVAVSAHSLAAGEPASIKTPQAESDRISFSKHIRPIFVRHCLACHGGVKQASGVSFIYRDSVVGEAASGNHSVVPGKPDESYALERVTAKDPGFRMPPEEHGPPLSPRETELLTRWIEQGARWERHWAYVAPEDAPLPPVTRGDWPRDPMDRYVLARLEREGLRPSPEADRVSWLRRVSFDLVGLPPTKQQLSDFQSDDRPDAFHRAVDRLLASPHFGERWASVWLDLVRYADTMGYEKDLHRDIWPYRDWVIRAFNEDMPYDQFTIKQIAGDLLPGASVEDRLATACHRNTQTNTEGGTDDEEFRVAAVIDRVNTTWQVWQGTTFGCVQCHSHPYDPFRHEEYYGFYAVFNTTRDGDLSEELPRLAVPRDHEQFSEAGRLDGQIATIRRRVHDEVMSLVNDKSHWARLVPSEAESTGNTRLAIVRDSKRGAEVIAHGTITAGSRFTIEAPLPDDLRQLSALRIDALPKDTASALRTPEDGFALTRLKASLLPPGDAQAVEVKFSHAWCDEPAPEFDPAQSLQDNNRGWASYTKIRAPRYAVFVLDHPPQVAPGSRLRLHLRQDRRAVGDIAMVLRRSRYSVSGGDAWSALIRDETFRARQSELATLQAQRRRMGTISTPVMQEQAPAARRQTHVFSRGSWLAKAGRVEPGTPDLLPPLPPGANPDRLGVAHWLVSPKNPLTARVMVNRVWEQLFGVGIVETAGDFGAAGAAPSHPQLLDFLALRFRKDHEWSLKGLLRQIVLSATYRQSSRATPALIERDPRNRLLARGPRQRLSAEMVRDQALVLSGRFSDCMFGPPVMPPQPDGIWRSVYSNAKWETDTSSDRYRRAVYTYWKRTSPYPAMMTFDAPTREVCSVRRIGTNSPLQALVTLNDPAFVELAQGLAERMACDDRQTPDAQIAWAHSVATGRPPSAAAQRELLDLYDSAVAEFAATGMHSHEIAPMADAFARVVVAETILNLDEVLTK